MDVQILLIIYATQHVLEMASCMILLTNLFYLYLKKTFQACKLLQIFSSDLDYVMCHPNYLGEGSYMINIKEKEVSQAEV